MKPETLITNVKYFSKTKRQKSFYINCSYAQTSERTLDRISWTFFLGCSFKVYSKAIFHVVSCSFLWKDFNFCCFYFLQEKLATTKTTPAKGENHRVAKRKLYSPGSISEDEGNIRVEEIMICVRIMDCLAVELLCWGLKL